MFNLIYLLPVLVVIFALLTYYRGQKIVALSHEILAKMDFLKTSLNTYGETFDYAKGYIEDGRQTVTKHLTEVRLLQRVVIVTCALVTWALVSALFDGTQGGIVFAALGAGFVTFSYNLIYEWSNHINKIIDMIMIGINSVLETKQVYDKAHETIGDSNNGK